MIITNVRIEQLGNALRATNEKHGFDLEWNRSPDQLNPKATRWALTIRSTRSGIPGSRTAPSGRKLVSASWHAHGHFFEEVFAESPDAVIRTGGSVITRHAGNWQDRNIGSQMYPCMMSETSL